MIESRRWLLVSSAFALSASAGLAVAQDKPTPAPAPKAAADDDDAAPQQLLLIEHYGMDRLVSDPRDAGMRRAFEMLPLRLAEIRDEAGADVPPEAAVLLDMLPRMIARPMRMGVAYTPGEPTGGFFNYGVVLSIDATDENDAKKNYERIRQLMKSAQIATKAGTRMGGGGGFDIDAGPGLLSVGIRNSGNSWRNEAIFGTVGDLDKILASPKSMLKGGTPVMKGRLDLAALSPAERMAMMAMGGNDGPGREVMSRLRRMGITGNDAMKIGFEVGHSESESIMLTRMEGAGRFKKYLHMTSDPLTDEDLRAMPADVNIGMLASGDLGALRDALDEATKSAPPVQEALDAFKQETGVDLRTDVIDALGGAYGYYMSESTGGGGLGSGVYLMKVRDRARFMKAHAKLAALANEKIEQAMTNAPAPYVKIVAWKDGSTDLNSLRFNGLPVPFELTYAVTSKWVIVGLTPQAVLAATRQAEGKGDAGIMSNPRVAALTKAHAGKLTSLNFVNTADNLRDGYTLLSMLGSGIANGVRSPIDPARDPGMVVPLYKDLMASAQPTVGFGFWEGDDLVSQTHGDRSMVVNLGATAGIMTKFAPLIAGVVGASTGVSRGNIFGFHAPDGAQQLALREGLPLRVLSRLEPWWNPIAPFRVAGMMDAGLRGENPITILVP